MNDGRFVEIHIESSVEAAELLAAALADVVGGVEIRDAQTFFPTAADRQAVVALCPPDERDDVLSLIDETLTLARNGGASVDPVTIRERSTHEDEWRDVWKQFFRTTRIGQNFVVRPSWDSSPVPPAAHIIELDPGRAFGTGAHPSTRLVIAHIEDLAADSSQPLVTNFLDLGCGSGILTIAAHRLWPKADAMAVDIDPESVACTQENLERNQITGVTTRVGGLDVVTESFSLVLANIQADVLDILAPDLPARLRPQGQIVLSGLLNEQIDDVRKRFEGVGFRFVSRRDDGEWSSLRLARG